MKNTNWHLLSYDNYGVQRPLVNERKKYTLLYNSTTGEYVVAYAYNKDDNTWAQGHYFSDFYSALNYMFSPELDDAEERKVFISNCIPHDWFDASQIVYVVDRVFDDLVDIPEIEEGHIFKSLKKLGYCD